MHRTIRATISSLLLFLLAVSAGTPLLDDAWRFRSLRCDTGADCAPAGTARFELRGFDFAIAAAGRSAIEQIETAGRTHIHSIARDDVDSSHQRHALDPARIRARVRAVESARRAADPVVRVALQGSAASPVRAPPGRS